MVMNRQILLNVIGSTIAIIGVITLSYTVGNTVDEIVGGGLIFVGTSLIALSKVVGVK